MKSAKGLLEKFSKLGIKTSTVMVESNDIYANLYSVMVGVKNDKDGDSTATIIVDGGKLMDKFEATHLDDIDGAVKYVKAHYKLSLSPSEEKELRTELASLLKRKGVTNESEGEDVTKDLEKNLDDVEDSEVSEGMHFNTRIRQLEAAIHPRKVKLAVREAKSMLEAIMDSEHPSASPCSPDDEKELKSAKAKMESIIEGLSKVRVAKRKRKNEDDSAKSFDDEEDAAAEVVPASKDEKKIAEKNDQMIRALNGSISKLRSKIQDLNDEIEKLKDKNRNESDTPAYEKREEQIDKLFGDKDKLNKDLKKLFADKKKASKADK